LNLFFSQPPDAHKRNPVSLAEWARRRKGLVNYDRSPGYALERFAATVAATSKISGKSIQKMFYKISHF
jgi:hypothetical protein